jgi:Ser/Thr protein kinase RdoA (MazF antagonist)
MSQPLSVPLVDTGELREVLQGLLAQSARRIVSLERRPSLYRSSFVLEELDVRFSDGSSLPLMFKDLSPQALLDEARRAKPAFLHDPRREIEVYRSLLNGRALGAPHYYGSVADSQTERYWLFLERVAGIELYQVGEFETWQQVARRLAVLHRELAQQAMTIRPTHLLIYDRAFYELWPRRAQVFLTGRPQVSTDHVGAIERLVSKYSEVVARLCALPNGPIHGEFYASNILVQETPHGQRVCPVDWEMAARGPGLIDLAALVAGKWSEEQKTALAAAYHGELVTRGEEPLSLERLLDGLQFCRLHLALQWLGWSPGWSPPTEHAHDWLSEALRMADKLGLLR